MFENNKNGFYPYTPSVNLLYGLNESINNEICSYCEKSLDEEILLGNRGLIKLETS